MYINILMARRKMEKRLGLTMGPSDDPSDDDTTASDGGDGGARGGFEPLIVG